MTDNIVRPSTVLKLPHLRYRFLHRQAPKYDFQGKEKKRYYAPLLAANAKDSVLSTENYLAAANLEIVRYTPTANGVLPRIFVLVDGFKQSQYTPVNNNYSSNTRLPKLFQEMVASFGDEDSPIQGNTSIKCFIDSQAPPLLTAYVPSNDTAIYQSIVLPELEKYINHHNILSPPRDTNDVFNRRFTQQVVRNGVDLHAQIDQFLRRSPYNTAVIICDPSLLFTGTIDNLANESNYSTLTLATSYHT